MDKIKNVLNPGFKDQDELLYDMGASKKSGHDDATKSTTNTTGTSTVPESSNIGSKGSGNESQTANPDPLTSRTATNQKEHMAPQDFAAARAVGTGENALPRSSHAAQQGGLDSTATTHSTGLTQPQHGDLSQLRHENHTGRNAVIDAGATGGAVGAQQHHEHNKLHKEEPHAAPSHTQSIASEKHAHHHTERDVAAGAGAVGAASTAHEHHKDDSEKEPKKNILKKIFGSSGHKDDKHDHDHGHGHGTTSKDSQHSAISGESHHHRHDNKAAQQQPLTQQAPANASIGGAQAAAPVGVGAAGAVFAAYEAKKHHHQDVNSATEQSRKAETQHHAASTQAIHHHDSTVQHGALPVADQFMRQGTSQSGNTTSGAGQPTVQDAQQHRGLATTPLGIGAVGAVVGAHEQTRGAHANVEQSQLTHHQHNTGGTLLHNQASGHKHEHQHHGHEGLVGESQHAHNPEQANLTGHEQRDLHQHGGNDTGLSHHVHNGVTPLPHRSHGHSHAEDNAGHHRSAAGPALGAGAATAGLAAASAAHHDSKQTGDDLHIASDESGPASKTRGPHSSNILNILDPRVKPDMQALKDNKEAKKAADSDSGNTHLSGTHSTQASTLAGNSKSASGRDVVAGSATHSTSATQSANATNIASNTQGTNHTFATSGSSGTHTTPAHTDDITGVVSGERGNLGDRSNVYSRKPLDDRVTMPGTFPDSSTNTHTTT